MSIILKVEAARYRLGIATSLDLVRASEAAVLAGLESASLLLLMTEVDPIMSDVGPLFERALEELAVDIPQPKDACWVILRHHQEQISSGAVEPRNGVQAILDEVYGPGMLYEQTVEFIGDSHGIAEMLGLFYGIDDIMDRPGEVSCDGKFGEAAIVAAEDGLRRLATKWLTEHGT